MNRRGFLGKLLGGVAAAAGVKALPAPWPKLRSNVWGPYPLMAPLSEKLALQTQVNGLRGIVDDHTMLSSTYGLARALTRTYSREAYFSPFEERLSRLYDDIEES